MSVRTSIDVDVLNLVGNIGSRERWAGNFPFYSGSTKNKAHPQPPLFFIQHECTSCCLIRTTPIAKASNKAKAFNKASSPQRPFRMCAGPQRPFCMCVGGDSKSLQQSLEPAEAFSYVCRMKTDDFPHWTWRKKRDSAIWDCDSVQFEFSCAAVLLICLR